MSATYEITVSGRLDDRWADWFGGVDLRRGDGGTTLLVATVVDQAQLYGLLTGLRDLNADLVCVRLAEPPPLPALPHPLRTARLTLRPARPEDAAAAWRYRRLDEVREWLTDDAGADPDRHRARFAEPALLADTVLATLGSDGTGPVIGDLALHRESARAQAELGWVLDPAHRGHGYATEAVSALLRHCFDDLGARRVTATCLLGDESSWRVMEQVGMRLERHCVEAVRHPSGRWLDVVGYALLAEEWRASGSPPSSGAAPSSAR